MCSQQPCWQWEKTGKHLNSPEGRRLVEYIDQSFGRGDKIIYYTGANRDVLLGKDLQEPLSEKRGLLQGPTACCHVNEKEREAQAPTVYMCINYTQEDTQETGNGACLWGRDRVRERMGINRL